jgi:hypothetical protein
VNKVGISMKIPHAIGVLQNRRDRIKEKLKNPGKHSDTYIKFIGQEYAALKVAIIAMEAMSGYGYSVVCTDGPLLPGQRYQKPDGPQV